MLLAVAQEEAISDPALDGLAADLEDASIDWDRRALLALTLARAGRSADRAILGACRAAASGAHRMAFALAEALIEQLPRGIEQADAGYRFADGDDVLYVEDPVAAHFHAAGRWGPPLRPDPRAPTRLARGPLEPLVEAVAGGEVAVVTFAARRPALRVLRAGLTRDASLRSIVRWPSVTGLGRVGEGVAYEVGGAPQAVGVPDALTSDGLLELLGRVRARALSPRADA